MELTVKLSAPVNVGKGAAGKEPFNPFSAKEKGGIHITVLYDGYSHAEALKGLVHLLIQRYIRLSKPVFSFCTTLLSQR